MSMIINSYQGKHFLYLFIVYYISGISLSLFLSLFFFFLNSISTRSDQRRFIYLSSKSHWSVCPINQSNPQRDKARERQRKRENQQKCPPHPLPFLRTTSPPPTSYVTSIATSVTLSSRYPSISLSPSRDSFSPWPIYLVLCTHFPILWWLLLFLVCV